MSAGSKKKRILSTLAAALGCGIGCRRPRASSAFQPGPRRGSSMSRRHCASSSSWDNGTRTTFSAVDTDTPTRWYSSDTDSDVHSLRTVRGFGNKIGGGSVAVEKDSDDPYLDFRQSMLQMILEREIYTKEELKELLNCFLQLNSPYYHGIIVRAFTEIWNGVHNAHAPPASGSGSGFGDPTLYNYVVPSRDFYY